MSPAPQRAAPVRQAAPVPAAHAPSAVAPSAAPSAGPGKSELSVFEYKILKKI